MQDAPNAFLSFFKFLAQKQREKPMGMMLLVWLVTNSKWLFAQKTGGPH